MAGKREAGEHWWKRAKQAQFVVFVWQAWETTDNYPSHIGFKMQPCVTMLAICVI